MPQNYKTISVVCPFFHGDDGTSMVKCEGVLGDESESIQKFRKKDAFVIQIREFCCKKYDCCPIYLGLKTAIYDEEDNGG